MNYMFVILLLTLSNTRETLQLPVSGSSADSETETITARTGDDVVLPCAIDWDPTQTKTWYKVRYKNINLRNIR